MHPAPATAAAPGRAAQSRAGPADHRLSAHPAGLSRRQPAPWAGAGQPGAAALSAAQLRGIGAALHPRPLPVRTRPAGRCPPGCGTGAGRVRRVRLQRLRQHSPPAARPDRAGPGRQRGRHAPFPRPGAQVAGDRLAQLLRTVPPPGPGAGVRPAESSGTGQATPGQDGDPGAGLSPFGRPGPGAPPQGLPA
ncbi:hypothetical protein D3C86_1477190 [compost metagenome]